MNKLLLPLKVEHDTDPEGRGYTSMTPEQAAADLNEKRYTEISERFATDRTLISELDPVVALGFLGYLSAGDALAQWAHTQLTDRSLDPAGLDVGNVKTRAMLTAYGADPACPLTPTDAETLLALASTTKSRAEQIGYNRDISADWILRVRGQ